MNSGAGLRLRVVDVRFRAADCRGFVEAELALIELSDLRDPLTQRFDAQQTSLHRCQSSTDGVHLDAALGLNSFDFLALTVQTALPLCDDLTIEEVVAEETRDDEDIAYETGDHQQRHCDDESPRNSTGLRSTALFSKEYDLHRFSNRAFRAWPTER